MRTTVNLDHNAYNLAKAYAASHRLSLGEAISRLILKKLPPPEMPTSTAGFPQFRMDRVYSDEEIKGMIRDTED